MSDREIRWRPFKIGDPIPNDAVKASKGAGVTIYVGRGMLDKVYLPANINLEERKVTVTDDGRMYRVEKYEILCGKFKWEPYISKSGIPENAISSGCKESVKYTDVIYIARTNPSNRGNIFVGKTYVDHNCLYFPFKGKEYCGKKFDILVHDSYSSPSKKKVLPAAADKFQK